MMMEQGTPMFAKQLTMLEMGTFPPHSGLLVCPHTPEVLRQLGLRDRPVLCGRRHAERFLAQYDDAKHRHGIPIHTLGKLPGYLKYPVMVMDAENREDSIVVLTDGCDGQKFPLIVSIHVEGFGNFMDESGPANYVTGVYGKRKGGVREMVRRAFYDDRILFADSKKMSRMFYRLHITPPEEVRWIDYDRVIRQSRNAMRAIATQDHMERYLHLIRMDLEWYGRKKEAALRENHFAAG